MLPYQKIEPRHVEAMSTVFQKGKIQLPAIVRRSLMLEDGDKIIWISQDGKFSVEKA